MLSITHMKRGSLLFNFLCLISMTQSIPLKNNWQPFDVPLILGKNAVAVLVVGIIYKSLLIFLESNSV
jgi:hypothetical protein